MDKVKTANDVTGVSCAKTGYDPNSVIRERVLSRAADPLTPEEIDDGKRILAYYLPIPFKLSAEDAKSNLGEVSLAVHDTAPNGIEAGGGLSCTHIPET